MTSLEDIIFTHIARGLLERVVHDQNIVDEKTRMDIFKAVPDLPARDVADRTVAAYGGKKRRLAHGLYEQLQLRDWETAKLFYPHFCNDPDEANHQASLVQRARDLPMNALSNFLDEVRGRVCLIVCQRDQQSLPNHGTGFLIAPDLVLTCRHLFRDFDSIPFPPGGEETIDIYFDFHFGDDVRDETSSPGVRKVGLAPNWHVASSLHTRPDGIPNQEFKETERTRITESLDFVLIRLDQKVGLQTMQRSGGRRRKWIELAPNSVPRNLGLNDWIIIPQHPGGMAMRIDLGRYREKDKTETRIRYSTNTSRGTSGAPCFNQNFKLVGLHNAYVGPENDPKSNQAIRLDHIATKVENVLKDLKPVSAYTKRWSVALPGEPPRIILGRAPLLEWIERALSPETKSLSERVYVAQATVPQAGCSFSLELLHAEIRGSKIPRCVYGRAGQLLPDTAQDFLKSLLRELGIDWEKLQNPIPPRPGAPLAADGGPTLDGEVDKLERWLSEELPIWLGDVISSHAGATETNPRPDAWPCAFVVIDGLRAPSYQGNGLRTTFTREVLNLIAALVKGKSEATLPLGLKRLRWLFLGYLPDFIGVNKSGDGATVEPLDPTAVSPDDVSEIYDRIADANPELPNIHRITKPLASIVIRAFKGQIAKLQSEFSEAVAETLEANKN